MFDDDLKAIIIERYAEFVGQYIERYYEEPHMALYSIQGGDPVPQASPRKPAPFDNALQEVREGGDAVRAIDYLSKAREKTFSEKLLDYIDGTDLDNADIYKAAGIDRRLFSKIQNNRDYQPSKDTCIALAFALKLDDEQAKDLLKRAGYAISRSSKRDLVFDYFFRIGVSDVDVINGVLDKLGEKALGKIHYDK